MNSSLFSLAFGRKYSKDAEVVDSCVSSNGKLTNDQHDEESLPNFNEFLRDTFVSKPFEYRDETSSPSSSSCTVNTPRCSPWTHGFENNWQKVSQPYFTTSVSTSSSSPTHVPSKKHEIRNEMGRTMDDLINKLYERIHKLENDVKKQDTTIHILENENLKMKEKKRKHDEILTHKKRDETQVSDSIETKRKERKVFMVVDEFEKSQQKANNQVKNLESYTVDWNGEKFVLIDAFSNKSDIVNYYYPLYQSNNPEKLSKIVLEREEYKKLFSTNPHVKESERKRAWRITIFSIEFYEFVKLQNK